MITLGFECLCACTYDIPRSQCYCTGPLKNSTPGQMLGKWAHSCLSHANSLSLQAHLSMCQCAPPQHWQVHSSMIIPACMDMQAHSSPLQCWQACKSVITLVCKCLQTCTCDVPRSKCYSTHLLENSTSGQMVGKWAHLCLSHAHSLSMWAHSSMCQYVPLQVLWACSSMMIPSRFIYVCGPAHVIYPDPSIVEQACSRIVCLF